MDGGWGDEKKGLQLSALPAVAARCYLVIEGLLFALFFPPSS